MPWATPVDRDKQILCACQPFQQAPEGLQGRRGLCANCIFSSLCVSRPLRGTPLALSLGDRLRLPRISGGQVGIVWV